jgi:Ca2+-binding RTX toxin-like protein
MTSFTITTTPSTAPQSLIGGEFGFVGPLGSLAVPGTAIQVTHANLGLSSTVTAFGSIHSNTGHAIGASGTLGSLTVTVGALGSITSNAANLATMELTLGGSLTFVNAGLVSGSSALRLLGSTSNQFANITNTGAILANGLGTNSAISIAATIENVAITNTGTITSIAETLRAINHEGAASVLTVTNDGMIAAATNTLRTLGTLVLDNGGTVKGNVLFAGSATLLNDGTIKGNVTDFEAVGSAATRFDNAGEVTGFITLGDGSDTVRNSGTFHQNLILGDGSNLFENLGGSLLGSVSAGAGNDTIRNRGTIEGSVLLGDGANFFDGVGGTVRGFVQGGSDNDQFLIDDSAVRIFGGGGFDVVESTANHRMGAGVEMLAFRGGFGLRGIGGDGEQTLMGGEGNDTLDGRREDDVIDGGEGDDLLIGGSGDDELLLSEGTDTMVGGEGRDVVSAANFGNAALIELGPGRAAINGPSGEPFGSATLRGIENARGGFGADTIIGSTGANRIEGGDGNDSINAAGGDDTILGGDGQDTLLGAGGVDVFAFESLLASTVAAPDLIDDFNRALEIIDVAAIDADALAAGDQAFAFIGNAAFAGSAPQLRFALDNVAGRTTVELRLAGSATPDMAITLDGLQALTAANFLL